MSSAAVVAGQHGGGVFDSDSDDGVGLVAAGAGGSGDAGGDGSGRQRLSRLERMRRKLQQNPLEKFPGLSKEGIARAKLRAAQMKKPAEKLLRPGDELTPKVTRNSHKCVKFVYLLIYSLMLWWVFSMPSEFLYEKPVSEGKMNGDAVSMVLLSCVVSLTVFCFLQGSDPGYLTTEYAKKRRATREAQGLIAGADDDGDDGDAKADAGAGPSDADTARAVQVEIEMGRTDAEGKQADNGDDADADDIVAPAAGDADDLFPLRSHYCRVCERRVATYDHHCFMVGTCIGEKNHCRFWWFLFFQSITLCLAIVTTNASYTYERYWFTWVTANISPLLADLFFWSMLLFVGGLWIFHSWLMCTSLTTYEMAKGPEKLRYLVGTRDFDLPFSRGLCTNLRAFCCINDGIWAAIGRNWKPTPWKMPGRIVRDSDNILDNLWENQYYSCC